MCRSRSRCWSSPRPCGRTACAGPRYAAGALTGLALAIGLECLPYLLVCAAAFALRYVVDRDGARGRCRLRPRARRIVGRRIPRRSSRPHHWSRGVCDAIAVNWLALVLTGGLGLWLGGTLRQRPHAGAARLGRRDRGRRRRRCSLWIEPRCLQGSLRHDGPGGVADLARACARDAAAAFR